MSEETSSGGLGSARADDVALELMKQLITLASGVLALSATFIEKLRGTPGYLLILLALSWLALIVSVFCGLQTISAIVKTRLEPDESDWSQGYGKACARLSKYAFVVGIALFATVALLSVLTAPARGPEQPLEINMRTD